MRDVQIDERDRKDYYSPSTNLFLDHCSFVASRYNLDLPDQILQCEVRDISYSTHPDLSLSSYHGNNGKDDNKIFTVTTNDATNLYARSVVLAIGFGSGPPSANPRNLPWKLSDEEKMAACHVLEMKSFPSRTVRDRIQRHEETNVVVVGGGLTSAQVADMAIRKGVTKVWLLMRSDLKGESRPLKAYAQN